MLLKTSPKILISCIAALFFMLITAPVVHSEGLKKIDSELRQVPSSVQTTQALTDWLAREFKYRWEFPDRWQSPSETITAKSGDCEDFALLVSAFLTRQGVDNNIAIVKFRGLEIAHAICVWKDANSSYNFISNRSLKQTKKKNLAEAIEKYYPDWEKIILSDAAKKHKKTIVRK